MGSLLLTLISLIVGYCLSAIKDCFFDERKRIKKANYLAIEIVCMLEMFIDGCVKVTMDDGLCCGQYNSDGMKESQVKAPEFKPRSIDVEWESISPKIMYKILVLPIKIKHAISLIDFLGLEIASPPDFEEFFEERQYQYALLGIEALDIVSSLCECSDIPQKEIFKDYLPRLNETKERIESNRKKY
ncbi:hypothetical protein BPLS_P2244 [Bathymodiolus platifrons methanotrophic gill symbiont]|uniref:hypothetical protein n=1 Tax=Bathymodiolus platifrons methanotrophic gill symbiont TaxID=113268 RepID=UPI001B6719FE|nr:hypothetical protein [Bathymodiolus platifrons methanotrophic gill symbiont]GFO75183.1 hypothetical protein BPLS_P2244 [Bathymodiolus platifrons methanotrophic gill symbiont]